MGIVYRVEHLHLGKTAAMKVLSSRYRRQAGDAAPIPPGGAVGQQAQSSQHRPDLRLRAMRRRLLPGDGVHQGGRSGGVAASGKGRWSFARAARLFIQVCSGLTEAHDAGIMYRDLKPENLMVVNRRDGSEHVKVLDFGLAKLPERADGAGISTGGQVLGTPYYMAPEQVRGERIDARADIYSLGATLYRVLTGEPPFDAPSPMSVLTKHLTDDLIPPRDRLPGGALPLDADRIVLRAMARSPRSGTRRRRRSRPISSAPSLSPSGELPSAPRWRSAAPSPPARRSPRRPPRTRWTVPRSAVCPRSTTRLISAARPTSATRRSVSVARTSTTTNGRCAVADCS